MSEQKINVIALEPFIDSSDELVRVLGKGTQAEVITVPSPEEALQVVQQFLPCLMIVSIRGTLDGQPQTDLLKKIEKLIHSGRVKPLVISSVKKHPLARSIAAIGITDYVEEPVPIKSLFFKLNLIFKAIKALLKTDARKAEDDQKRVFKAAETEKLEKLGVNGEVTPKFKPALQLGEDTFVFKNAGAKKIGKAYTLRAEGPLPETGSWMEEPGKDAKDKKWRWVPKKEKGVPEEAAKGDGWVHEGEEPVFETQSGKWRLKSEKPHLFYRKDGKNAGAKVDTDENGHLNIAEDSATARDNLMLNKTMVSQEKEERIRQKQAAKIEEERATKASLMVTKTPKEARKAEELAKKAKEDALAAKEKLELKKKEEQAAVARDLQAKGEKSEAAQNDLRGKDSNKGDELQDKRGEESADEHAIRAKKSARKKKEKDGEEELEIHSKDPTLEGLKKEDLAGEQNLRDRMRDDVEVNLSREKDPEGLSKEQLASSQNSFQDREGKEIRDLTKNEEDSLETVRAKKGRKKDRNKGKDGVESSADRDEEKDSDPLQRKKRNTERARKRIEKLKAEEQEDTDRPIREEISKQEEAEIRRELGLQDKPEIDGKELQKRAKMRRSKDRKKAIQDLEESLEGKGAPLEALLSANGDEEPEVNDRTDEGEENKRNFRAIDSIDEEAAEGFFESKKEQKKKDKKDLKKSKSSSEEIHYLPRGDVQPQEGSWECEGEEWVYLPNFVFDSGFEKVEQLLPLWVFSGETEPELLESEQKWKFLGSAPQKIEQVSELPKKIRALLQNLCDQASMAQGKAPTPLEWSDDKPKKDLSKAKNLEGSSNHGSLNAEDLEDTKDATGKKRGLKGNKEKKGHKEELHLEAVEEEKQKSGELKLDDLELLGSDEGEKLEERKRRKLQKKSKELAKNGEEAADGGEAKTEGDSAAPESLGSAEWEKEKKKDLGKVRKDDKERKDDLGSVKEEEDEKQELGSVSQEDDQARELGDVTIAEEEKAALGSTSEEKESKKKARKLKKDLEKEARAEGEKSDNATNGDTLAGSESALEQKRKDLGKNANEEKSNSLVDGEKAAGFELGKNTNQSEKPAGKAESQAQQYELFSDSAAHAFQLRELLVFVAIEDVRRSVAKFAEALPTILRAMEYAMPQCSFAYAAPGMNLPAEETSGKTKLIEIRGFDENAPLGQLVARSAEGRPDFSPREIYVLEKFAQALGRIEHPHAIPAAKAA